MTPEWLFLLPLSSIKVSAKRYDVDPALVAALVWQESRGRRFATRYEEFYRWTNDVARHAKRHMITYSSEEYLQKQSYGLMQMMGGTARYIGFTDPLPTLFDTDTNLDWGVKYFKTLVDRYRSTPDAISAYNQGSPRKDASGEYRNQKYVLSVLGYRDEINITR